MASPIEQAARALLDKALAVTATTQDGRTIQARGGRTGEGGPIRETPFVEIGDVGLDFEGISATAGARDLVTLRLAVIFYRTYAKEVDREKEELRELFWAFRDAVRADYTLGGLVDYAHVASARATLEPREGQWFWAWITVVEVIFEA